MWAIGFSVASAMACQHANAATSRIDDPTLLDAPPAATETQRSDLASTRDALALSMGSRLDALRRQGPQGYRNLVSIMFDAKAPMNLRWKATTAIGRIGGELSQPEIERAFRRGEWFMRSAAMLAMRSIDKEKSLSWARQLLSDRALVVRSAAVDAIDEAKDAASAPILWAKLASRDNFNDGDSLWIRRRIVETLAKLESAGSEARFMKVLSDRDESLHGPAIEGLERITRERLGGPDATVSDKRALWLKRGKLGRRL